MRLSYSVDILSLSMLLFCLTPLLSAAADTFDETYVAIEAGTDGRWPDVRIDRAMPSEHHLVECRPSNSGDYTSNPSGCSGLRGNWSIDFYDEAEEPVLFRAEPYGGSLYAKVWAIAPTCTDGYFAGQTVFIDIYVNGAWQGWISYGHLEDLQVSVGQEVTTNTILGFLERWPNEHRKCWWVNTPQGVHTHIEMANSTKYSCYVKYGSGERLNSSSVLGLIGRTDSRSKQSECSDRPPPRVSVSCENLIRDITALPAGYGAPINFFRSDQLSLSGSCVNVYSIVFSAGTGSEFEYIYQTGYIWNGSSWRSYKFNGTEKRGEWIIGKAAAIIRSGWISDDVPKYIVAYICNWDSGAWKCGCQDRGCESAQWQLQMVRQKVGG